MLLDYIESDSGVATHKCEYLCIFLPKLPQGTSVKYVGCQKYTVSQA